MFIETGFKEVRIVKNFSILFVFGCLCEGKLWSFIVKRKFTCNPITCMLKLLRIHMVKTKISILNRLEIVELFCKSKVNTYT